LGKGSIVIPFFGILVTSILVYVLRNSLVNDLIINTYGGSVLAYIIGLVNATLLMDDMFIFIGTWLFSSFLIGYITKSFIRGGFGSIFMIPIALFILAIFTYMIQPVALDLFIEQQVSTITSNATLLIVGIVGCGTLGSLIGRIKEEPELDISKISSDEKFAIDNKCPNCGKMYLSNTMYCSHCGHQIKKDT